MALQLDLFSSPEQSFAPRKQKVDCRLCRHAERWKDSGDYVCALGVVGVPWSGAFPYGLYIGCDRYDQVRDYPRPHLVDFLKAKDRLYGDLMQRLRHSKRPYSLHEIRRLSAMRRAALEQIAAIIWEAGGDPVC